MGFNYGLEKRKFTEEWKKLYSEYKAAGMSEEDIQDIYAFCVRPECVQEKQNGVPAHTAPLRKLL